MSLASAAALVTAATDVPAARRLVAMDLIAAAHAALVAGDTDAARRAIAGAVNTLG